MERRYLREARRLQRFLSWLAKELGDEPVALPAERVGADVAHAASGVRDRLGISIEQQTEWPSPSRAFAGWRSGLEELGVHIFMFPMGMESCRGFSIWDDFAPLLAVNTAWVPSARVFTLFHEYGHLATRTDSACAHGTRRWVARSDPAERWCEEFAAATLMPAKDARLFAETRRGRGTEGLIRAVAGHFSVSLRAAALRLVELGLVTWDDYESLPPFERKLGGGGKGRDRAELREAQYGLRTGRVVGRGLKSEIIGRGDVLDYLDVPEATIDRLGMTPSE